MKNKTISKQRMARIARNKTNFFGTLKRPRLAIYRSNKYISAQLIDDQAEKTLISIYESQIKNKEKIKKTILANKLGTEFGIMALKKKITRCVFDRRWYKYHGRIKQFAEGARKSGLKF